MSHDSDPENQKEKWLLFYTRDLDHEEVETLLEEGADVNYQDRSGKTALIIAVEYDDYADSYFLVPLVKVLLAHGADVSIEDNNKRTAMDYAKTDEIKQLLETAQLPGPKPAEKSKNNDGKGRATRARVVVLV
jgi:ankyrin repeat protein